MKKILFSVFSFCLTTASFAQNAIDDKQTRFYIQTGLAGLDLKVGTRTYDLGTTSTNYAGLETMGWLGIELNYSTAVSKSGTASLDFIGGYLRPFYKVSDSTQIFLRAGSNNITLGTTYGATSATYTSYGVGANWFFDAEKSTYLQVDYMMWGKERNITLSGLGIAVGKRF